MRVRETGGAWYEAVAWASETSSTSRRSFRVGAVCGARDSSRFSSTTSVRFRRMPSRLPSGCVPRSHLSRAVSSHDVHHTLLSALRNDGWQVTGTARAVVCNDPATSCRARTGVEPRSGTRAAVSDAATRRRVEGRLPLVAEAQKEQLRPLVVDEDTQVFRLDRSRLHLTPGMTGPWHVLGTRVPMQQMVGIDDLSVANWSLWLGVKILLRTVHHVVWRGISEAGGVLGHRPEALAGCAPRGRAARRTGAPQRGDRGARELPSQGHHGGSRPWSAVDSVGRRGRA